MMSLNKTKYVGLLLLLSFFNFSCQKESPNSEQLTSFVKYFGGAYSNDAIDMIDDYDSYIITGNQYNDENVTSILVYKTDKYGNTIWKDTIDNEGLNIEVNQLIKLKQQDGYGLIGTIETDDNHYYTDVFFIIITNDGSIKTQKIINDTLFETGNCITELTDGNFILSTTGATSSNAGATNKMFYLTNAEGDIERTILKSSSDITFTDIAYNESNGAIFLVGSSDKGTEVNLLYDDFSFYAAPTLPFTGTINAVVTDADNNLFICGKSNTGSNGKNDILIAKINNNNESGFFVTNWQVELGSSGDDYGTDIQLTTDNTLLVTGSVQDTKLGTYDFYTVELDTAGMVLHTSTLGGSRNEFGIRSLITFDQKILTLGTASFNSSSFISLEKYDWKSLK